VALAEWEHRSASRDDRPPAKITLGKKQFKKVSEVSEGFDQYMTDLMGGREEADMAAFSGQRFDFRHKKSKDIAKAKARSMSESESDVSSDDSKSAKRRTKVKGEKARAEESEDESASSSAAEKRRRKKRKGKAASSGAVSSD